MGFFNLKNTTGMIVVVLVLAFGVITAQAIPITVEFTAYGFLEINSNPVFPPTDPVSGTIVYEAASINSNIDSLTSIILTIDGHIYALNEVGYVSPFGGIMQLIGGNLNGVNTISSGTNDFWLRWAQNTLMPSDLVYASSNYMNYIWRSQTFSQFSITSVPEPSTMLLMGFGLLGLLGLSRKFKK